MKTDLYTAKHFHVQSEKMDNCPLFDDEGFWMSILITVNLVTFFATLIIYPLFYEPLIISLEFGFFMASACIRLVVLSTRGRCGIKITLRRYHGAMPTRVKYYQFTDDTERDARKIKKVVESFSLEADKRAAFEEAEALAQTLRLDAERAKSAECCTRYKDVIQKVKPDESD
jgi:hypothetical protein